MRVAPGARRRRHPLARGVHHDGDDAAGDRPPAPGPGPRETYVGPWLPEPVADDALGPAACGGAERLALAGVPGRARVARPGERAAFLLREVFGSTTRRWPRRSVVREDACRQLVSRAKQRVGAERPRFAVDPDEHRRLLARFVAAGAGRRPRPADVGPHRRRGAGQRRWSDPSRPPASPIHGVDAGQPVPGVRRAEGLRRRRGPAHPVNGEPGFQVVRDGTTYLAGTIEVADGAIIAIRLGGEPRQVALDPCSAGVGRACRASPLEAEPPRGDRGRSDRGGRRATPASTGAVRWRVRPTDECRGAASSCSRTERAAPRPAIDHAGGSGGFDLWPRRQRPRQLPARRLRRRRQRRRRRLRREPPRRRRPRSRRATRKATTKKAATKKAAATHAATKRAAAKEVPARSRPPRRRRRPSRRRRRRRPWRPRRRRRRRPTTTPSTSGPTC